MLTKWQRLVYVEQRNVPLVIGLVAVDVELCGEASIYDVQVTRVSSAFYLKKGMDRDLWTSNKSDPWMDEDLVDVSVEVGQRLVL